MMDNKDDDKDEDGDEDEDEDDKDDDKDDEDEDDDEDDETMKALFPPGPPSLPLNWPPYDSLTSLRLVLVLRILVSLSPQNLQIPIVNIPTKDILNVVPFPIHPDMSTCMCWFFQKI